VSGSVSWLYYADRLMEFPAGVLGAALGTILLPSLSKTHAGGASDEYSRLLDWGLRLTLLLALPAAVALAVLALPLIATLFHYGRFNAEDAWMTREALVAYSLGLLGLIFVKILAPGFYAAQNVATPVKIGLVTLAATQTMNLAFIGPLKHAGLALAIGLGACLNALLLYRSLRRRRIYAPQPGWTGFALKVGLAALVMAAALWYAMGPQAQWLEAGWRWKVPMLAGLVLLGIAAYGSCLYLLGLRVSHFSKRVQ
jgi:putative peptidoglycan lipid II flippase